MQIKKAIFAVAFGLVTASTVAGEWLKVSPGNSYDEYCKGSGTKFRSSRLCVNVKPSFFKRINEQASSFQGYISSDATGEFASSILSKAIG